MKRRYLVAIGLLVYLVAVIAATKLLRKPRAAKVELSKTAA